jgi:aspartate racemase
MKHIGIVDIATVGACICANAIVAESVKQGLGDSHPEFTMHSFPFQLYKDAINESSNALADLIVKLIKVGAEFIVIPSNTPHYAIDMIQQLSPIPVLNIIEITLQFCVQQKFKKVCVLGTKKTMEGGLYANLLELNNIIPVIPSESIRNEIEELIFDQIIPSRIDYEKVNEILKKLKALSCEAYILGCTELPVVFDSEKLGRPTVDTTNLLGIKALEFSQAI